MRLNGLSRVLGVERGGTKVGFFSRAVVVVAAGLTLSGCAAFHDPNGFLNVSNVFADKTPYADYALAAIARNDLAAAEAYADKALQRNPKDPYGLLAAGIIYQNTGRPQRARAMYQEVMAANPPLTANVLSWSRLSPQTMADIASNNLQVMDLGAPAAAAPMQPQPQAQGQLQQPSGQAMDAAPVIEPVERNIADRFEALGRLFNEGLITEDEYVARRTTNLGAMLPLSQAPPSAGLEQPVPPAEEIVSRLKALRRAFEMRAITAREHGLERTMILDALLPATPANVANPPPPPAGIMEAAKAVGRLERLRNAGLISSNEFARERAAIDSGVQAGGGMSLPPSDPMVPPLGGEFGGAPMGPDGLLVPTPGGAAPSGNAPVADPSLLGDLVGASGPGVHLASYRSRGAAEKGTRELQKKYDSQLSGLGYTINRVEIPRKGTFFRIIYGPLGSTGEAKALCNRLKAVGQYCKPESM